MTANNLINVSSAGIVGKSSTTFAETAATQHAVLVGGGTSSTLTNLSVGATGTILAGATAADPSFSATPTLTSIKFGTGTTLSTYVQNTFVPQLRVAGSTTGITYTTQSGEYAQIGNLVFVALHILLSSKGAGAGSVTINLPVTNGPNTPSHQSGRYSGITFDATYKSLGSYIQSNGIQFVEYAPNGNPASAIQASMLTNTSEIYWAGYYFTS